MLYTFSQANYSEKELTALFKNIKINDYVIFWQDGVLLPIKYFYLFNLIESKIGISRDDIYARNLKYFDYFSSHKIDLVTLDDIVEITVKYHPQICL